MARKPNSPEAGNYGSYSPERDSSLIESLRLQANRLMERLSPLYSASIRRRALYFRYRGNRSGSGSVPQGYDEGRGYQGGRPEGQQFRSIAAIPLIQRTIESKAAALTALICKPDPMIDCDATTDARDGDAARFATSLLHWTLYRNKIRSRLAGFLRDIGTDGTKFVQTLWRRETSKVYIPYSDAELESWQQRVLEAANVLQVEPPDIPAEEDPQLWQRWIDDANATGKLQRSVPDVPMTGTTQIRHYEGPVVRGVWYGDVLVHPEQEWDEQRVIVHRQWMPVEGLRRMASNDSDESKPLSARAVEYAVAQGSKWGSGDGSREQYLDLHYKMLGVERNPAEDEQTFGGLVLVETFYRRNDPDEPFIVLANRCAVINKVRDMMPFMHGRVPLLPLRLVHIDGSPFGLSAAQQTEPLAYESNRILAHVLDAMLLAILPVFTRLKDVPWPARLLRLSAGMVIPVPRHDVLAALTKGAPPDLGGALNLLNWLAGWNDDAEGTPAVLRGQSSGQGGRPSATSVVQDLNQATNRIGMAAMELEDDLDEIPRQHLGLWYEHGEQGDRRYIGGKGDPYITIDKAKLAKVLDMDFIFRGATRAINRELLVNMMLTFGDKFGATMMPSEVRSLAERVWEEMGLRRRDEVLNPVQTEVLRKQDEAQVKSAAMQAAGATAVPMPQAPQALQAAPQGTPAPAGGAGPADGGVA